MCDAMDADEVEALLNKHKEQDAMSTKDISRNAKGKNGALHTAKRKKGVARAAK